MQRCPRKNRRRGVLLLIVLSLLVLFVLIGVTFVVVANQYTRAAKSYSLHELKGDRPQQELDTALLDVLRGSTETSNPTYDHSLLEDVYGNDGFIGRVLLSSYVAPPKFGGQQFRRIVFQDVSLTARPTENYYSGGIITLIDGRGAKHSARILRYVAPIPNAVAGQTVLQGHLVVAPFAGMPGNFSPASETRFVVNGRAFNGVGKGLMNPNNQNKGDLTALLPPFAVMPPTAPPLPFPPDAPLQIGGQPLEASLLPLLNWSDPIPTDNKYFYSGDADESWDSADYQNMFLARIPSSIPVDRIARFTGNNADPLIPSFHRPYLINHLLRRLDNSGWNWSNPTFQSILRYATARPLPFDHPYFTGSNPAYQVNKDMASETATTPNMRIPDAVDVDFGNGSNAPFDEDANGFIDIPLTRGPWDVDNDRDGIADSVWIDLGAPIKTSPDGRVYKPLFAVLCIDMDGRVNINAHGTREMLTTPGPVLPDADPLAPGSLAAVTLGQGYGPADIRLDQLIQSSFGSLGAAPHQLYATLLASRYQPRTRSPMTRPTSPVVVPALVDWWIEDPTMAPGSVDPIQDALLNPMHLYGLPVDYLANMDNQSPNYYGSPADVYGIGGVYTDFRGQPRFIRNQPNYPSMGRTYLWDPTNNAVMPPLTALTYLAAAPSGEALDNPYQMDLVNENLYDSPYGEEDLEYLLRYQDPDVRVFDTALKQTLDLGSIFPLPENFRRQATTRSFDIPTVNFVAPDEVDRSELLTETQQFWNTRRNAVGALPLDPKQIPLTSNTLVDLAIKRLTRGAFPFTGTTPNQLDRQLRLLLAPEIRQGKKFDINRPFGNGIDDNNNGTVDEPAELWSDDNNNGQLDANDSFNQERYSMGRYGTVLSTSLLGDPNYAAPSPANNALNPYFSRQRFARYLFCLAMLALDENFRIQTGDGTPVDQRLTARRIAQWAINVVDFRDSDAVMTPFEYDWQPFNGDGWAIDGDYRTEDTSPDRQLVWGCEAPELLITESLAFHDRRVRDTEVDEDGHESGERFPAQNKNDNPIDNINDVDEDLDQVRIPQGSLFLEFYATGNNAENNPVQPAELYFNEALNLAAMAGADRDPSTASPVWRIAIAEPPEEPSQDDWRPAESALFGPQFLNSFIEDPETIGQMLNQENAQRVRLNKDGVPHNALFKDVVAPRFFVFAPPPTSGRPGTYAPGAYFHNINLAIDTPLPLFPGRYAVAGPREVTPIGSLDRDAEGLTNLDASQPSTQTITLSVGNVTNQNQSPLNDYWNVQTSGLALPPLTMILAAPSPWGGEPIGMNVSEPKPIDVDRYYPEPSGLDGDDSHYSTALDQPLDSRPDSFYPLGQPWVDGEGNPWPHRNTTGTYTNFRIALLQRLADPTRPWHLTHNPYLTVDAQTIDLTVFNGEEDSDDPADWENANNPFAGVQPYDTFDDPDPNRGTRPDHLAIRFGSRQRGQLEETTGDAMRMGANIWSPLSMPTRTQPLPISMPDPDLTGSNNVFPYSPSLPLQHSLGALNIVPYGPPINSGPYLGTPVAGFPWLTWNNRPFISNHELMLVPSSAPWRLNYEIRSVQQREIGEYFYGEFAHLINFFHENDTGPDPNLAAFLDWVEVPSRFAGTYELLNPLSDFADFAPMNPVSPSNEWLELGVPMNQVSKFRAPGKININTLPDQNVWRTIDVNSPPAEWNRIRTSLRGDVPISDRPAFYTNPVRAAGSGGLMPRNNLNVSTVDATLLRRRPDNDEKLLFDFDLAGPANNGRRNPYFRYHKLQRLSNLLTSHSNVYAVWITVGYFEVYPWPNPVGPPIPDVGHPDGYQLGLEMGSDTGNIKRHRAFYLIDRSIPVGFERGKDHNVEDAVLLRRFIE